MKNLLGIFVAGVLYFVAVLPPDQPVLRQAASTSSASSCVDGGIYTAAVLGRLHPARQPAARSSLLYHPRLGTQLQLGHHRPRVAGDRSAAFALLYVTHHRRPGLPAGHLPRHGGRRAASSTAQVDALRAERAGDPARPRRHRRRRS
ncbi:MAG: hypothetical protein MZW92_78995 [Comamonadaceae bacterium]|nr:hypothetical protein [Comamonadaceae bacterium]